MLRGICIRDIGGLSYNTVKLTPRYLLYTCVHKTIHLLHSQDNGTLCCWMWICDVRGALSKCVSRTSLSCDSIISGDVSIFSNGRFGRMSRDVIRNFQLRSSSGLENFATWSTIRGCQPSRFESERHGAPGRLIRHLQLDSGEPNFTRQISLVANLAYPFVCTCSYHIRFCFS